MKCVVPNCLILSCFLPFATPLKFKAGLVSLPTPLGTLDSISIYLFIYFPWGWEGCSSEAEILQNISSALAFPGIHFVTYNTVNLKLLLLAVMNSIGFTHWLPAPFDKSKDSFHQKVLSWTSLALTTCLIHL